jgi:hypothetical protein
MKKFLIPIVMLVTVLTVASCNKEKLNKEKLAGTWYVYKYLLYNIDRTDMYFPANDTNSALHPYTIAFTEGGQFTEIAVGADSTVVTGTWVFEDNLEKITLEDTVYNKRTYTIYNLTRDHVELLNDSTRRYMRKFSE